MIARWQVTATTFLCSQVNDFATVMVYPDKTTECAYVNRYKGKKDGEKKLRNCMWPECPLVRTWHDKMITL